MFTLNGMTNYVFILVENCMMQHLLQWFFSISPFIILMKSRILIAQIESMQLNGWEKNAHSKSIKIAIALVK